MTPLQRIVVPLGERSYDVIVGHGAIAELAGLLPKTARQAAVVTQATVPCSIDLPLRRGWRAVGVLSVRPGRSLDGAELTSLQALGDLLAVDWETTGDGTHASNAEKDRFIRKVKELRPDHRVLLYANRNFWLNIDTTAYAGDGLWSREEDVYNPLRFLRMTLRWAAVAEAHGTLSDEGRAYVAQYGG